MAELLILIGLPGSGKSTLAAQWALLWGWDLVSTDAIRAELYGDAAIQGDWNQVFGLVQRRLQQVVLDDNLGAIFDATNVQRRSRRRFILSARSWGYQRISALWLDVPLAECLARNEKRDRQVPPAIIQRMARQLQGATPTPQEGLDALIHYHC